MAGIWSPHQHTSGIIVRRSARLVNSGGTSAMTMESSIIQASGPLIPQKGAIPSKKDDVFLSGPDASVNDDTLASDPFQEEGEGHQEPEESKKRTKKKHGKKRKVEVQTDEDAEDFVPKKKPRKKRSPKPEPTYIIPEVERKTTTFKGRLGAFY